MPTTTEFTVTDLPRLALAQLSARVGDMSEIEQEIGPMFDRVVGTLLQAGVALSSPGVAHYTVDGDGLIFFNAQASEASNRLQQLGRIQADGGTVDLRAAARGAFADTVLNLEGVRTPTGETALARAAKAIATAARGIIHDPQADSATLPSGVKRWVKSG